MIVKLCLPKLASRAANGSENCQSWFVAVDMPTMHSFIFRVATFPVVVQLVVLNNNGSSPFVQTEVEKTYSFDECSGITVKCNDLLL